MERLAIVIMKHEPPDQMPWSPMNRARNWQIMKILALQQRVAEKVRGALKRMIDI